MSSGIAIADGEASNCLSDTSSDAQQTLGLVGRNTSTSPVITNLPADILLEVFYTLTFDEASYQSFAQPVPLVLGAVCPQFRRLAWERPSLWTDFHLYVSDNGTTASIQLELVQEWLGRSGGCSLDLALVWDLRNREDTGSGILHALSSECRRWRSLSLYNTYVYPFWDKDCQFPLLEDVSLGEECAPPSGGAYGAVWTFDGAQLRRLEIASDNGWTKDHFRLEWTSIQTIRLFGSQSNINSFLPLVAANVRDAQLCFITKDRTFPPNIRFPALNSLRLGDDGDFGEFIDDTRSIIASLYAPSLTSLTVFCYWHHEDPHPHTHFSELVQMIERSQCALVELNLYNFNTSTDDIVRLVEHIPTLQSFELTAACHLTDRLFEAMTPTESSTLVLPQLTRWVYKGSLEASPSAMANCLRSRVLLEASALPPSVGPTRLPSRRLDFVEFHCWNPSWDPWAEIQDPKAISSFDNVMSLLRSRGLHFRMLR